MKNVQSIYTLINILWNQTWTFICLIYTTLSNIFPENASPEKLQCFTSYWIEFPLLCHLSQQFTNDFLLMYFQQNYRHDIPFSNFIFYITSKYLTNKFVLISQITKYHLFKFYYYLMKFIALVSGGKDSVFNIIKCIQNGHQLVALANLYVANEGFQQDSYMYQTVGTNVVQYIANAMQKPLIRKQIKGTAKITALDYKQFTAQQKINDEVEDLFQLIKQAKQKYPDIQGVSSGAIMSTYQKLRVQDVCNRLGLKSLAYLWQRDQTQLLKQMIDSGMQCVIIKIASYGLFEKHLNKSIKVLFDYFQKLKLECGMNVCGQGGEFQSLTLDCSLFKKSIEILEYEIIYHDKNQMAPVAYLKINKLQLKQK